MAAGVSSIVLFLRRYYVYLHMLLLDSRQGSIPIDRAISFDFLSIDRSAAVQGYNPVVINCGRHDAVCKHRVQHYPQYLIMQSFKNSKPTNDCAEG